MSALAVVSIIEIVALWRIFTKAGENGWKCLIPIYNIYILFKIAKNDDFLTLMNSIVLFTFVALIVNLCLPYGMQYDHYLLAIFFLLVCLLLIFIYLLVVLYKMFADLSERFGQERIFALGLLLLNPVFVCIIGFGNAEYRSGATEVNNVLTDTDNTE